ncbi:SRPBCC family protein [Tenacibaculum maritimum]|uniref:SRPBCC family protein n=1 Tax=Tenacibaculum maritimum TaxID=107401 RepID=UPI0038769142
MKTIKIILGIIIVLVVAFFATGIVVKDIKYTAEVEINKNIKTVFSMFTDAKKFIQWQPEIIAIRPITEKEQITGSTYELTIKNGEQKIKMQEVIKTYLANQIITFQFRSNNLLKTDIYTFQSKGGRTKIIQNSALINNSYIASCVFPYFKGALKEKSQESLERLKKIVEQTK